MNQAGYIISIWHGQRIIVNVYIHRTASSKARLDKIAAVDGDIAMLRSDSAACFAKSLKRSVWARKSKFVCIWFPSPCFS